MISPQFQFCKTKIGFWQQIAPIPFSLKFKLQQKRKCLQHKILFVRAKSWTPEVAQQVEQLAATCDTPVLTYLMQTWDKAQNLTEEKIKKLRERELQLIEEGQEPFKRMCRLKISIANSNNTPWNVGLKHKEETKKKIQASLIAKYKSPVLREELRKRMEGYKHTDEAKAKIKKSLEDRYSETRKKKAEEKARRKAIREEKLAEARKKREEEKERLKQERMNRKPYDLIKKYDPEGYAKMMEEKRKKISETVRKRWQDPECRARMVGGMRRYAKMNGATRKTTSEETRKKLSEAAKSRWGTTTYSTTTSSLPTQPIHTPSKPRQKKEEVVDTAEELMSHLISTKQHAYDLQLNIQRLEGAIEHLRNDEEKLEKAEKSLARARKILKQLEATEYNIKGCIASVLGQDQMQDVEEMVKSQIVTKKPNQRSAKKSNPTPASVQHQNGNSNGTIGTSQSFEVSSNNMQGRQFVNGARHQNGEPDFLV